MTWPKFISKKRLAIALIVVVVGVVALGPPSYVSLATHRAQSVNRPEIIIGENELLAYPDPLHIQLADGRVFRLAHVTTADPGTSAHTRATEAAQRPLSWGGNRAKGLHIVGVNPTGETLVELWGFHSSLGGCGNRTWSEELHGRVPHWNNLTWQLLSSGWYWLEPTSNDSELRAWESAARRSGDGLWSDTTFLRAHLDVRPYEAMLDRSSDHHHNYDRRQAADLLLRTNAPKYAPLILSLVKNREDRDAQFRSFMAQSLERAGYKEGTEYLIDGLRARGNSIGLDEYALNSVVLEYQTFWNAQGFSHGDHTALVRYYDTKVSGKPSVHRD